MELGRESQRARSLTRPQSLPPHHTGQELARNGTIIYSRHVYSVAQDVTSSLPLEILSAARARKPLLADCACYVGNPPCATTLAVSEKWLRKAPCASGSAVSEAEIEFLSIEAEEQRTTKAIGTSTEEESLPESRKM